MIEEKTNEWFKRWRDAANILAKDPKAEVVCPECGVGHLKVKDEAREKYRKLDRYMICDSCKRWNVMTMEIPENYFDTDKENKE